MFSMPSGMELILIVVLILLLFGGKKIPELAKGIGSGIKNFKNALKEEDEEVSIAKSEKDKNNTNSEVKVSNEKVS
ncbi:twin-arginine translocase TatA/TatE family subunit [Arcobacter cloacae]|uniref:Sec-independent protein translocase protein TatA n=1 Tax=Arcobacter cloacae TaxID=1054034 RepID=A0A6M8NMT5_9BACT|nr:twin-arginine translocase TatA/TatE family subunit [Arcobacter cloacae]QKF88784.1 twin arginine translocation system, TatA/E family protein [Arcobacter cloacae]RXI37144.1 twin-arginine translocase TatA/TatE family subunit [Arcobacter cloacae]